MPLSQYLKHLLFPPLLFISPFNSKLAFNADAMERFVFFFLSV